MRNAYRLAFSGTCRYQTIYMNYAIAKHRINAVNLAFFSRPNAMVSLVRLHRLISRPLP